jgi:hypothetical protein
MENNQWPTREEWAESQRAFYYDRFEYLDFDARLSAFTSPTEVETLISALQELWKAEGAQLRALNIPRKLKQQRGESGASHFKRWMEMNTADQELMTDGATLKSARRCINKTIKVLRDNRVPYWISGGGIGEILKPILARYEAARKAAEEKRKQEILATSIDDAAWEEELQRRADLDQRHKVVKAEEVLKLVSSDQLKLNIP